MHRLLEDCSLIIKVYIGSDGTLTGRSQERLPWVFCVLDNVARALRDATVAEQMDGLVLLKLYKNFLQLNYRGARGSSSADSLAGPKLLASFKKVGRRARCGRDWCVLWRRSMLCGSSITASAVIPYGWLLF